MLSSVNCAEADIQHASTYFATDHFTKGSLQDVTHFHSLIQVWFPSEELRSREAAKGSTLINFIIAEGAPPIR